MIIKRTEEDLVYIAYKSFEDTHLVIHGVSTRSGGVSTGHLSSMNLSFAREENQENVRENYRRIGRAMGFLPESLVFTDQTHTANIRVVTEEDRGKGFARSLDYHDIDGLVTNVPGITLAGFYADCVPLLFLDPVKKCIGVAHSGWRGTRGRIGAGIIDRMKQLYGSDPSDILCVIGPSICGDCYEVGEDVAGQFRDMFPTKSPDQIMKPGLYEGKFYLNLWEINRLILLEAGITPSHLEMPGICTCCNPQFLFSHRASKGQRGNIAAFLQLKP